MATSASPIFVSEEQGGKPVVGISRIADFFGRSLARTLLNQNCIIIALGEASDKSHSDISSLLINPNFFFVDTKLDPINKELIEKIRYFFALVQSEGDYGEIMPLLSTLRTHQTKIIFVKEVIYSQDERSLEKVVGEQPGSIGIYLSDLYGPGMDKTSTTLARVLEVEKEPETKFSPLFITDAIHAVSKAMFGRVSPGQIFFVSGGEENEKLGWRPRVILKEGVETINKWLSLEQTTLDVRGREASLPQSKPIEDLFSKSTENFFLEEAPRVNARGIPSARAQGEGFSSSAERNPARTEDKHSSIAREPWSSAKEDKTRPTTENTQFPSKITPPKSQNLIPPRPKRQTTIPKSIIVFFASILILIFLIATPLLVVTLGFSQGTGELKKSQEFFQKGKIDKAKTYAQNAEKKFIQTQKTLENMKKLLKPDSLQTTINRFTQDSQVAIFLAKSIQNSANAVGPAENLLGSIKDKEKADVVQKTLELKEALFEANQNLAQAEAIIKETEPKDPKRYPLNILETIRKERKTINIVNELLGFLPSLTAQNGKKTYLVLFQNNMELRPAGGFIGSYAVVTFESGGLFDVSIEDSSTADSQLKGHVWPPAPLVKYLGQQNWYLRDSNWDPDFIASARKAEWFFTKETGKQIDGVISVDNTAIQYLLGKTGPLEIPEFKETIDSKNLLGKVLFHSEKNLFDGASAKRDPLAIIGGHLWEKMLTLPIYQYPGLIEAILQGLEERHIQVFMHDPYIEPTIVKNGWGGVLRPTGCKAENCVADYFLLVDGNLGANKANYYLKRRLQKEVSIEKDGQILSEIIVTLENTSPTNIWPAGAYKTYLRAVVPRESKLLQVKIDGKISTFSAHTEGEPFTAKPGEIEVDVATESATPLTATPKVSFGLFLEVPIKTSRTVGLLYKLPQKLNPSVSRGRYELLLQKQAGTGYDPSVVTITFPQFLKYQKSTPEMTVQGQLAKYTTDLSVDREIFLDLTK